MYFFYNILANLAIFISPVIIIYRIFKGKEDAKRVWEKFCIYSQKKNNKNIWIHAASVGELMSVVPVIKELEKNKKTKNILLSTSTTSSAKIFKKLRLKKTSHFKHLEPIVLSKQENIKIIVPGPDNSRRIALNEYFTTHNVNILKTLEMDGMIGTLELIASSDWCSVLPAVLCDLDLDGSIRTLSPLISPNFTTEYVLITSASKELNPISKLFSEKISKEIKLISSKMNNNLAK